MSGLAGVLAGRHAPGVYRWHGNFDTADVRHTVEHAGWRYGHLDGWEIEHKAEFLSAVGEALDLPSHYGQNLDALADCLGDLGSTVLAGGAILVTVLVVLGVLYFFGRRRQAAARAKAAEQRAAAFGGKR